MSNVTVGANFDIDADSAHVVAALPGLVCAIFGLIVTAVYWNIVSGKDAGTDEMKSLATKIHDGARDFLHTEYKYLAGFVVIIFVAVSCLLIGAKRPSDQASLNTFGLLTALPLLGGAILSASSGYAGMLIATKANVRTTQACTDSINAGLQVAFKSGAVMGLSTTGLGLLGLSAAYLIFIGADASAADTWQYLSGFGFGASCIALFARVGGGVYTKAADVGADLVGKVEAGIPEDHPNNAAVIADNVGDNVGDVAGMGADLFESYVGSIIAACTLATTQFKLPSQYCAEGELTTVNPLVSGCALTGCACSDNLHSAIALPFWIAGFGIVCSVIGTMAVCTSTEAEIKEDATNEEKLEASNRTLEALLYSINRAIMLAGFLVVAASVATCFALFKDTTIAGKLTGCVLTGLVSGILIGQFTEYSTAYTKMPTQSITAKGKTGPATVIIQGLGVGMIGCAVPTIIIIIAICACNALAGLYGIAIAAVGMLSTLGVTLATDAYGPVADNAGGIAEMIPTIEEHVRDNTDALDAMGNTTAATGKGFAIGSAVLTSAGLIAAFMESAGLSVVSISNPLVLSGTLIGAALPFVFAAITMLSVGKSAEAIIFVVRDEFVRFPQLKSHLDASDPPRYEKDYAAGLQGKPVKKGDVIVPNYQKCVSIATSAAINEMIIPGGLAVFMPVIIGFLLSAKGLAGMLIGALSSGFMLAVAMSNAGGAWDNAKKYAKALGYKDKGNANYDKEHYDATVVGDTVGDPFKDTSGPALNILIKLMSVVALVIAPALKSWQLENGMITEWEPKSVGLGTALLFVIFIAIFLIQRCVDRSYAVQRKELDDAVAKLKADRAESGEQKTMDDDAAWADLKEVVEENAGIAQFFKDLVASQTAAEEGDDEGEEQEPSATASAITTLATRLGLAAADSEEETESKAAESAPASKDDAAKPEALEVELDASS